MNYKYVIMHVWQWGDETLIFSHSPLFGTIDLAKEHITKQLIKNQGSHIWPIYKHTILLEPINCTYECINLQTGEGVDKPKGNCYVHVWADLKGEQYVNEQEVVIGTRKDALDQYFQELWERDTYYMRTYEMDGETATFCTINILNEQNEEEDCYHPNDPYGEYVDMQVKEFCEGGGVK